MLYCIASIEIYRMDLIAMCIPCGPIVCDGVLSVNAKSIVKTLEVWSSK